MSKDYSEKFQRIKDILYMGKDHFMSYDLLLNKKKKLLIGASSDSIYYYQFFILFTGVQRDEACKLLGDEQLSRWLRLSDEGFDEQTALWQTKLEGIDIVLKHKDIFYAFPTKPLYTGIGIQEEDKDVYTLLNFTDVIDRCFALEDACY